MNYTEYNAYKKMKRAIAAGAGGGMMAGMLIIGAGSAYAETTGYVRGAHKNTSSMHLMRRWNSESKINSLAVRLGLNKDKVKNGLRSGKGLKQILIENGIAPGEINRAFKKNKEKIN